MDVSIIIVNYNTLKLTNDCIESIIKFTKDIKYEIILVDNNSQDGSQEYFAKDRRVSFIETNQNLGFGRGNNVGVEHSKGKYLFFLNSDTVLTGNSIKKLFDFAEANKQLKIGELGILLLDKNNNYNKPFSDLPSINYLKTLYNRKVKKMAFNKVVRNVLDNGYAKVGFVCGADVFTPRKVIDDIGGAFDPDFFMFCEEIDMAKRMEEKGYNRIIINDKNIIHFGSSSFDMSKMAFARYKMMTQSAILYHKKHDNKLVYLLSLFERYRIARRDMKAAGFSDAQKKEITQIIFVNS